MNTKLKEKIIENLQRINIDEQYDDTLDECFSFKCVGGIFAHMLPSRVLQECDPVAYRCGFSDYIESQDLVEINGDYYDRTDCEEQRDKLFDEMDAQKDELAEKRETMEAHKLHLVDQADYQKAIDAINEQIDEISGEMSDIKKQDL